MTALVDTSCLLAYFLARDSHHAEAREAIRRAAADDLFVPADVLHELFYMIATRLNYTRAVEFNRVVRVSFEIVPLTAVDYERMQTIMLQYASAEFDYTDTAIMALAERLGITQVYTFDRRDFTIFRPVHCEHLQLLP